MLLLNLKNRKTWQLFFTVPSVTHRLTEAWKISADKFNSQASVEPLTGGCQWLAGQMRNHRHMTLWLGRETEKTCYFPLSLRHRMRLSSRKTVLLKNVANAGGSSTVCVHYTLNMHTVYIICTALPRSSHLLRNSQFLIGDKFVN